MFCRPSLCILTILFSAQNCKNLQKLKSVRHNFILRKENGDELNFVKISETRYTYRIACRLQPGFEKCLLVMEKDGNMWKLNEEGVNRKTGRHVKKELYESDTKNPDLKDWKKI